MNNGTILLVEDNPDDALLIERVFRAIGIVKQLVVVTNGVEAIRYLKGEENYSDRAQYPVPCLILLDLEMPQLNGLEFLVWLRQRSGMKQLPVVVLTTSVFAATVRTAYLLGANSFLTKPVDFAEFKAAMRQMCDFWLGDSRLPEPESEPDLERESQAPGPSAQSRPETVASVGPQTG